MTGRGEGGGVRDEGQMGVGLCIGLKYPIEEAYAEAPNDVCVISDFLSFLLPLFPVILRLYFTLSSFFCTLLCLVSVIFLTVFF